MAPPALVGINHVAVVTADLDRRTAFYRDLFEISVVATFDDEQGRHAEGHHEMFDRGHIDHLALAARDAASFAAVRAELVRRRLSDGAVNELGVARSVYFEDPDGMGCEVLLMEVELATILDQVETTSH